MSPASPLTLLADGGARQGEADLWCSYAAVRTLHWLGEKPARPEDTVAFLTSRQNADGGFAWQRGLPSDVWATYYCAQALGDLGHPLPDPARLADWLAGTRTADGGYAMTPGQGADIWAVYYATRVHREVLGRPVPDPEALGGWLAATQHPDGGLGWSPGSRTPDVRAGYYGALAWRAAAGDALGPWDTPALTGWLQDQQDTGGGFRFGPTSQPCAWAAFRAVRALDALGAAPRDPDALRRWLADRRLPGGGHERWAGYGRADVWSAFSVVGALQTLGDPIGPDHRAEIADQVRGCQLPGSGFTYTEPGRAGDSLATAAVTILTALRPAGGPGTPDSLVRWLRGAHLPYEDGVMYMPGRGAEVRCTLWAVEALAAVGESLDTERLGRWVHGLQNTDGGFGYWLGRGSDLVSTVSAVEALAAAGLDPAGRTDAPAVLRFLASCRHPDGYGQVPGAEPTLAATAQAARVLDLLGEHGPARDLGAGLAHRAGPLGGFGPTARGLPDLLSTYQAVLTQRVLGLPVDLDGLRRFLAKVRVGSGFAWSPLSRQPAGLLAACLGEQLAALAASDAAPARLLRLNL
ncbi:prenyltransferase/squalene oxidase repeat-containing protein [Kitasatospora sp. NPDC048540]|uniref:prenyltransferase/squalene oxidase repeat-containing protein n=1 Tax=unclassified Kitasatospora TaxID=2633591 RepID=UPI00068C68C1|nr:prenyltransferase/squalene oxidase repeat-containing protein [Kitasatospora sp. MBT63]